MQLTHRTDTICLTATGTDRETARHTYHKVTDRQTYPLHAVPVAHLQLLLGSLEAGVLVLIGRGLEVHVHVVRGLGGGGDCGRKTDTWSARGKTDTDRQHAETRGTTAGRDTQKWLLV